MLAHVRKELKFEKVYVSSKQTLQKNIIFLYFEFLSKLRLIFDGKTDLLFVTSSDNHHLPLSALEATLEKKGVSYAYITNKIRIYRSLRKRKQRVYFIDSDSYNCLQNNFYLGNATDEEIYSTIENSIMANGKYFENLEKQWDFALNRLKPKVLISGNELLLTHRVGMFEMQRRKLKTLVFQHGQINSRNVIYAEMICDKFLLYGELSKREVIKIGISESKISVVGKLQFADTEVASGCTNGFTDSEKKNVLIAFSGFGNGTSFSHHRAQIDAIHSVARLFEDVNFIFKLHPKDDVKYYSNLKSDNIRVISDSLFKKLNGNLKVLIANCCALITSISAIVYDAFELSVPVCILDLNNEYKNMEMTSSNAVTYCEGDEALKKALKEIFLTGQNYATIANGKEYLSNFYCEKRPEVVQDMFLKEVLNLARGN
jgi:hypothetical protein